MMEDRGDNYVSKFKPVRNYLSTTKMTRRSQCLISKITFKPKRGGTATCHSTMAATPISILTKVKGKQLGWGEGLGQ